MKRWPNDIGGALRNPVNVDGIASICPSLGRVRMRIV